VLWGGCPMVTLPLERMASRVAASLCYATGLGHEMVVSSQQEYEVGTNSHPTTYEIGHFSPLNICSEALSLGGTMPSLSGAASLPAFSRFQCIIVRCGGPGCMPWSWGLRVCCVAWNTGSCD
jgi:hypothetical protein